MDQCIHQITKKTITKKQLQNNVFVMLCAYFTDGYRIITKENKKTKKYNCM